MGRKTIVALGLVCLLGTVGLAIEEETSDGRIWFGLGGSTFGLLLPDLASVDAFLIDRGFGGSGVAMLFTGDRGRGGPSTGFRSGRSASAVSNSVERSAATGNRR